VSGADALRGTHGGRRTNSGGLERILAIQPLRWSRASSPPNPIRPTRSSLAGST